MVAVERPHRPSRAELSAERAAGATSRLILGDRRRHDFGRYRARDEQASACHAAPCNDSVARSVDQRWVQMAGSARTARRDPTRPALPTETSRPRRIPVLRQLYHPLASTRPTGYDFGGRASFATSRDPRRCTVLIVRELASNGRHMVTRGIIIDHGAQRRCHWLDSEELDGGRERLATPKPLYDVGMARTRYPARVPLTCNNSVSCVSSVRIACTRQHEAARDECAGPTSNSRNDRHPRRHRRGTQAALSAGCSAARSAQ